LQHPKIQRPGQNQKQNKSTTKLFTRAVSSAPQCNQLSEVHTPMAGPPSVHQTLRVTPAMEAGIIDHIGDVENIIELLEK
jgi:hypothetical protein